MTTDDTDRAGDVAAAFDSLAAGGGDSDSPDTSPVESSSGGSTDVTPAPESSADASTSSTAAQRARDEAGRFARASKQATSTGTPKAATASLTGAAKAQQDAATLTNPPEAAQQAATATAAPLPGDATATTEALKPPQSWTVTAKEAWKALPKDIQQEVVKREKESLLALRQYQDKAKTADAFQQVVSPYVGFIQAEGGDVMGAVGNLLQTAVALRTAPPAVKGQLLAQMIDSFGVDLDHINAAWEGRQVKDTTSAAFDPRSFAQQVRQEVMRDLHAERQKVYVAKAQQQLEDFSQKAEFFDDVREDLADILEVASRRGLKLSLEDAYNRACAIHPKVSEVLAQRREAQQVNANQASTQQSLRATSSVRGEPSAVVATPEPASRRGDIEAAFAKLSGGR